MQCAISSIMEAAVFSFTKTLSPFGLHRSCGSADVMMGVVKWYLDEPQRVRIFHTHRILLTHYCSNTVSHSSVKKGVTKEFAPCPCKMCPLESDDQSNCTP